MIVGRTLMEFSVLSGVGLAAALNAESGGAESGEFIPRAASGTAAPALLTRDGFVAAVNPGTDGYLVSYWSDGRQLASGWTRNVAEAAASARFWVAGVGLERLAARHPFVDFSELQLAFERGNAKETQWRILLDQRDDAYWELVDLASKDAVLSALFPRLGHRFVLSTDEHSDGVLVSVFVASYGRFMVYNQDGSGAEFEGDAMEMCRYLSTKLKATLEQP